MPRRRSLSSRTATKTAFPSPQTTFCPPADTEYVRNWTFLAVGDKVILFEQDAMVSTGLIDALTADADILWVHLDGGVGRRLFIRSEGCLIWRLRRYGS